MREIKFRAWENGKMYYQGFVVHADGRSEYPEGGWDLHGNDQKLNIMQYTGLSDKNGKEIYEGDIVYCYEANPQYFKIRFIEGGFCLCDKNGEWCMDINIMYPSIGCGIEVVDNIYENPELLED